MRRPTAVPLLAPASFAFLLLAGCGEPQPYRAETELRADGTVSRTVQQDDLAGTDAEWDGVRTARKTGADDWPTPLAGVPTDAHGTTKIAWGDFLSPAAMPNHIREGAGAPTRLARTPVVTDHGILTVYEWRETVEPGTDLLRADAARSELVQSIADLLEAAAAEALPPGTNAAPLVRYVRTTGDAFTSDVLRLWFRELKRPTEEEGGPPINPLPWAELFRDYGLDLFDADGEPLVGEPAAERLGIFIEQQVRSRLLTADGGPLDDETWAQISFDSETLTDADRTEAEAHWDRAAVAVYGSVEQRDAHFAKLFADLLGGVFSLAIQRPRVRVPPQDARRDIGDKRRRPCLRRE